MKPAIEVKNISKKYILTHQGEGYITLRDTMSGIFKRRQKKTKETFWALKDINFTVNKGEVVGIIGHNGAGKSTLLKILSQITPPTTGEITIQGRVGSLLEVGTGFHPELTGRENIYLNGAILGMKKKEITKKFDEIVAFAGVEKFLDTPVKRYSSGMYVRLAFSVAAHMEPDILIIDEVLAVGDAEFQKKCLGKMDEITKKDGRTILFVSHNIDAIRQLCHKTIVLDQGKILFMGKTDEAISAYLNAQKNALTSIVELPTEDNSEKIVLFKKIQILNDLHTPSAEIGHNEKFSIEISYEITEDIHDALLCVFFMKDNEYYAISTEADSKVTNESTLPHEKGVYTTRVDVPAFVFEPGYYNLMISIQRPFIEYIEKNSDMYINIVRNTAPVHPAWKEHVSVKVAPTFHYHTSKQ